MRGSYNYNEPNFGILVLNPKRENELMIFLRENFREYARDITKQISIIAAYSIPQHFSWFKNYLQTVKL